ncbi:MAG: hypothetical protein QM311_03225 [Acidobacteriota bacterium]|nr:hypothetical protein [Acidobacteriota bacterium]
MAQHLRDLLVRLNPALPAEALDDAFRKRKQPQGAELIQRNRALRRLRVDGVAALAGTIKVVMTGSAYGSSASCPRNPGQPTLAPIGIGAPGISPGGPLPHHPACGSAPGGSWS